MRLSLLRNRHSLHLSNSVTFGSIRATSFAAAELPFQLAQNALMVGWLSAKASGESSLVALNILTAREGRLYPRLRDAVVSNSKIY